VAAEAMNTSPTMSPCVVGGVVIAPAGVTHVRTVLPFRAPARARSDPVWTVPFGAVHRAGTHAVCTSV